MTDATHRFRQIEKHLEEGIGFDCKRKHENEN